jgi:hypothetical protein
MSVNHFHDILNILQISAGTISLILRQIPMNRCRIGIYIYGYTCDHPLISVSVALADNQSPLHLFNEEDKIGLHPRQPLRRGAAVLIGCDQLLDRQGLQSHVPSEAAIFRLSSIMFRSIDRSRRGLQQRLRCLAS